MIHDDAIEQVKQDLYTWGRWVNQNEVVAGYGNSSISRLDKDETKHQRQSKRENLPTLTMIYRDGRAISAQYGESAVSVPVQEIATPNMKPALRQHTQSETVDDLCLEIEQYLALLRQKDEKARRLVNCIYRYGWPREVSMQKLRITKHRYDSLATYIPVFILGRRYENLTLGRPNVIRV